MNKSLLIKHICGEASRNEELEVLQWIAKSADNRKYYANLKNLIVAGSMPGTPAEPAGLEELHWAIYHKEQLKKSRIKRMLVIASSIAGAAIMLLAYILPKFAPNAIHPHNNARVLLSDMPEHQLNTMWTENGIKGRIVLPDSSVVMLNSASSITYPVKFSGSTREISFSGEGYFDIKTNPSMPMTIKTNRGIDVVVYGTEFNLNTFKEKVEATLYSGKIKLVTGSEEEGNLRVTEMVPHTKTYISATTPPETVSLTKEIDITSKAWTEGILIFDSTPLSEVIEELKRWHGVEIVVEDSSILNYKITGKFKAESIVQIADFIKYCSLVDYSYSNNTLYLKAR